MDRPILAAYLAAGYDIIPLHVWDHIDGLGRQRGKSPRDNDWLHQQYTPEELEAARLAGNNFGVRLRHTDLVIDYDPRNDEEGVGLAAFRLAVGPEFLDACPLVVTGSGGFHWYAGKPEEIRIREHHADFGKGVEFKTCGRQVVSAGSRHPNGTFYALDDFCPPLGAEVPTSDLLIELIERPGVGDLTQQAPGRFDNEQLARLLADLDPEDFQDHGAWLEIGMASHHATNGAGLQAFIEWSAEDGLYAGHGPIITERWPSFLAAPGEPAVTAATLLMKIREADGDTRWIDVAMLPADLPDDLPALDPNEPVGPDAPLERLNRTHAFVMEGKDAFVYRRQDEEDMWHRTRIRAFKDLLATQRIEDDEGRQRPVADTWMRWPGRRSFAGVEFVPPGGKATPNYLNTWTGWGTEPAEGSWDLFHELVTDVIAQSDKESAEYLFDWVAYMLQHPAKPAEVAVVFKGKRGVGKSTFGNVLYEIVGRHHGFIATSGLARQFNSHLREIVFLLAEEAFWAGEKKVEGQLKSMITSGSAMYEPKGVDASMGRSYLHIVMTSNEDWVVPAAADERRYAVYEVSDKRKGDFGWWDRLYWQMAEGGTAGFMRAMLARDLSGWHPRNNIPQTSALVEQKLQTLDLTAEIWMDVLKEGKLPVELPTEGDAVPDWWDGPVVVTRQNLAAHFSSKIADGRRPDRGFKTQLGRRLKAMAPVVDIRTRTEGGRIRLYEIPSLPDCRKAFESYIGGRVDWEA